MLRRILLISFTLLSLSVSAQKSFTISGFIKDKASGEMIIGATVSAKELINRGAISNAYGFYSLTLPEGKYTISYRIIGYKTQEQIIDLKKSKKINISLETQAFQGKEVEITADRPDENVRSSDVSKIELSVDKIKLLPAFMGEVDILKTIQLLPGVQSAGEGNSGFYVRGGGPDQNLILLDEAVIFNASHLFGFFSVFNSDAINNMTFIKGGMPSNYGGRLASVLDINMKEGNNQSYHAEGGIGLISSRLTLQGPIVKDKSSFIVSGRRTYIDFLAKPIINSSAKFKGSGYYFYDLNAKLNYTLSDKDRIFISGYLGKDILTYKNTADEFEVNTPWGNSTVAARWNHLFSDKLFLNTTAIFSDYHFNTNIQQSGFQLKLFSGIQDWNGKMDFTYIPNPKHTIKFGGNYVFHTFTPSSVSAKAGNVELRPEKIVKQYANEYAGYILDDFELNDRIKINAGVRYSIFQFIGPYDRFIKNFRDVVTDTLHYKSGESIKLYQGIEPRISARFGINPKSSIKASYTHNYQYLHLTSFSSITLPTDVWVPSSLLVQPQIGDLYVLGYFRNFKRNIFETSVELYYKTMKNQVEYKDGVSPSSNINDNIENNLAFGTGKSYGAELFLKKSMGIFTGWIGYTLSYTTRKFPDLNDGKEFYARYDRRHDLSAVLTYELNSKWTFSTIFVYATGNATSLPTGRYFIEQMLTDQPGGRNTFRMDPYHRLDLSATLQGKKTKKFESSWNFSVYNVYNRKNPYFIYFNQTGSTTTNNLKIQAKQVSLFPILPSVTWNFKF